MSTNNHKMADCYVLPPGGAASLTRSELAQQLFRVRADLKLNIGQLVLRNQLAKVPLEGGCRHHALAEDVIKLVRSVGFAWPRLQGRTGLTQEEIASAYLLAKALISRIESA